jgi:hypothetical protein
MTTAWRKPNPHSRMGGRDKVYTDMAEFINQEKPLLTVGGGRWRAGGGWRA